MDTSLAINAIRVLSADMVQKANSGHPGLPLGAAPMAYELWANHLNHDPKSPDWVNRDRFILSAGHGCALLYSLLHLYGYGNLGIEDLKGFRQWGSLTPGHPEYGHTIGVEATTGPLGAGLGMAVGMALAEAHLAERFNKEGFPVMDHYTFALCGDGCLMEGISSEVMSLAGTLGLGKLIILYDSNSISIEGGTDLAFTENVAKRFEGFGFQVLDVEDGNNVESIGIAIELAKKETEKPSLIRIKTTIGYGVPEKQGTAKAHGEPLGWKNVEALRKTLSWPLAEAFAVPEEVYAHYRALGEKGGAAKQKWDALFAAYQAKYPEEAALFTKYFTKGAFTLPADFWDFAPKDGATRSISGAILGELKDSFPNLIGGAADLSPSTKTHMDGEADIRKGSYGGRNIHFGVRELGMTSIGNGILLHGGLRSFVSTFFVFSDYMKPMIRLGAIMGLPLIMVLTHDSIGVGEDGPTHEPIEQLSMLRSMPNVTVFRPADEMECRAAWEYTMMDAKGPVALALTRQNIPTLAHSSKEAARGGYVLEKESGDTIDVILMASGSEVHLAVEAKEKLAAEGKSVRVVSMPSIDRFLAQSPAYREEVLPKAVRARVAIEAGSSQPWGVLVGLDGACITMDRYGASAPAGKLFEAFGFTTEHIVETANEVLIAQ